MKPNYPVAFLLAWLGLALAPTHAVWAADASSATQPAAARGTLTGTVTNSATGRTLEGVRVVILGTGREAITDSQGVYRFGDIAPGSTILSLSYTGLRPQEVPVTVAAGVPNRQDVGLTSDVYVMGRFIVSGEREGNAQAITLQRLSHGVKTMVATDAYGNLAGNPADLLIRLPGVEGVSTVGDIRTIKVRGLNSEFTTITMDGNRMASAHSGVGSRSFVFDTLGSDAIARVEVVKSPTPDMDGDSIGGAVNMASKSAFDSSPERRIRGTFGAVWNPSDPRATRAPRNYSLSYSEVFAQKLGVAFSAAYYAHNAERDQSTQSHALLPAGSPGPAYTYAATAQDARLEGRVRMSSGLRFDYKLSDHSRFYLNTTLNKATEHANLANAGWSTGQAVATRAPDGSFTGTGGIIPGYTDTFTAIRPVATSALTIASFNNYLDQKSTHAQFNGVHTYKYWDIDYNIYKSNSKSNYAGQTALSYTVRGIGFTIDRSGDPDFPTITQTAGPDITRLESYTDNSFTVNSNAAWDSYRGAALNVRKKYDLMVPAYIKTGLRLREQIRRSVNTPYAGSYVGPDGVMGVNPATGINDDNLAQFGQANRPFPNTKLSRYPRLPFPPFQRRGNFSVDNAIAATPQYFRESIAADVQNTLTGNQKFTERIDGYYLIGAVDLGKLSVLGGARVEITKVNGEGALQALSPEERARRAAWVGPVTDAEQRRRTTAEYSGRVSRNGEIRNLLPGVHFKLTLLPQLVTRLSYATNIGRPAIGQLIPSTNVNYDTQLVSSSNPGLKPQTANNFDLTVEYYFEPAGVLSAGVFLKEIKNFIYTAGGATIPSGADNGFGGEYAGYTLTTQYNGGFAKVRGLEFNYIQQFTFLPGFLSGFGAYANYTRLEAEGNYGTGSAIALVPANQLPGAPTKEVAGFNPLNANVGISYIKSKATVRFQYNYRGRFLNTFNTNQSRLQYAVARSTLSLKTQYRFSKHYDAYFDVINILNKPDSQFEFFGGRPASVIQLSPQLLFGITARM